MSYSSIIKIKAPDIQRDIPDKQFRELVKNVYANLMRLK